MKNITSYLLVIFLVMSCVVTAQNVEFKRKNFKDKDEEFKNAVDAIDAGEEFYEVGSQAIFQVKDPGMAFKKALQQFEIAQKLNPNNALNNFRVGVCHIYSTSPYKAIPFLYKAAELDPECDPFLYYYLGWAQKLDGKLNKSLESFNKFEEAYRKADNFSKFVSLHKRQVGFGKKYISDPVRCWIDNVTSLNSPADDIAPTITMDGFQLIFSSNRKNSNSPNEIGEYDHNIYVSYLENGRWNAPRPIPGNINSPKNDIVNNLDFNGQRLLLSKENEGQTDIYESKLTGASWSFPELLPRAISSDKTDDNYGAYSPDGYNITFSRTLSNRGDDIMYSAMQNKMKQNYMTAARIGKVSSAFNDGPIYLHIDDKTMYIASEGHESMGGYDIFVSYRTSGNWSKPVNMGYPINTPYDDFFFAATANGKFAYISSNRPNGKGGFDLYKVTFWGPPKEPVFDTENYLIASIAKPMKDPQIKDVVSINKVSLTVFKGKTIDAITRKPVEASIEITDNATGQVTEKFATNSATGKFLLALKAGTNYGIAVKADGYLFHSENFDIPKNSSYNLVNKVIELKNIAVGSKIQLRNIFFDIGKATLRSESHSELNRLVQLLKDVPSLKVEISGHTDNTGSASLNKKLSQDRAESVVNYLISKGISSSRLVAKGYGPSRPVASNNTANGRQQNRRTEFEILAN